MKSSLKQIVIASVLLLLSACDKGGDDNKAVIATPVGIPAGRVNAQNYGNVDQNNYCEINANSMVCFTHNCASQTIQFTDITTLCQNVQAAVNSFGNGCGQMGMQAVLQQRCQGVGQTSDQTITPVNSEFREIKCEFEANRIRNGRWMRSHKGTGLITGTLMVDPRYKEVLDLRTTFGGLFDIGQFGTTKLTFTPASIKGTADTITLSNRGLNKTIEMKQSGFAGQVVKLEAESEDESISMRYKIACKGLGNFKRVASSKSVSKYVCTGKSRLGFDSEDIDVSLPYNTGIVGTETELADKLTMNILNDRVEFTATGIDSDVTVKSSGFLKEKVQFTIANSGNNVDVTCSPK